MLGIRHTPLKRAASTNETAHMAEERHFFRFNLRENPLALVRAHGRTAGDISASASS
jgi:hypothetical protein